MKRLVVSLLFLLTVLVIMTAFGQPNIYDHARLLDAQTVKLIRAKNNRYLQTREQPQVSVITVKHLSHLTPRHLNKSKRTAYVVVGAKKGKRNVQIFSSRDLHGTFTADVRMNIIRTAEDDLRSRNSARLNRGIRFVFRACTTQIDQRYQYSLDKYDLSARQMDKISHPHRVALPIALGIAVLVTALIYFFRRTIGQPRRH